MNLKPSVNLLGVNFAVIDLEGAVRRIELMIKASGFHQVGTMNPEYLVKAQTDGQLKNALKQMDLVVPDGVGIVLAARLKRLGSLKRIRGGDLLEKLAHLAAQKGYKIGLLGGERGVGRQALLVLKKKFPGLEGFASFSHTGCLKLIKKEKPQILFTALSFQGPVWLESLRRQKLSLVGLEVGGVFNYLVGKSRPPAKIIQQLGLEWLWRLINEPRRVKRQLSLLKFFFLLFFPLNSQKP